MIQLDNNLLISLGLTDLNKSDQDDILKHMLETLQIRLGLRLANQMTEEQFNEFEQYSEKQDQQQAFEWLKTNFPNYQEITQEEFDKLCLEVKESAPMILASIKGGENPFSIEDQQSVN